MPKIVATDFGGPTDRLLRFAGSYVREDIVTDATRDHERNVASAMPWPALPPHLRDMPGWRAMVRHEVRCGR